MTHSDLPIYLGELNNTPLGDLRLAASDFGLIAVEWAESQLEFDSYLQRLKRPIHSDPKKIAPYTRELREYLDCKRTAFTIPIDWTLFRPFQREALQAIFRIPYGETRTYGDIAEVLGKPTAARAVAGACGSNPVALLIPCHRAIRKDGGAGGYRWGVARKEALLAQERALSRLEDDLE